MNGAEYLRTLPAFVINLDETADRWAAAERAITPFVGELIRSPGVDGRLIPDNEVQAFRNAAHRGRLLPAPTQTSENWYRGAMGCWLAHIAAVERGADIGGPFLVLEDDARFHRDDLLDATHAPEEPGVHVWGGAQPGGSHTEPQRRYMAWRDDPAPNGWSRIGDTSGVHLATAYSFSGPKEAKAWAWLMRENPHISDVSWQVPMRVVPTFVPSIEVAMQEPFLRPDRLSSAGTLKERWLGALLLESIL